MSSKLILVEGLPGTGKSTISQWLAEQHRLNQIPAKWHYEISASNPLIADQRPARLPTENLFDHGLKTWGRCVKRLQDVSEVTIFDAGLFQHVTMKAFHRGCSKRAIDNYLAQVEDIILPLQPLVIYASPEDVTQHVEQIYAKRGKCFTELIVNWCSDSAAATRKGYSGYEGSIRFWSDFGQICDGFVDRMRARGIRFGMNAAKPNWSEHQSKILHHLQIAPMPINNPADPNRFVGTYFHPETGKEFTIRWDEGELCATGILDPLEQESVLIASENDRLLVRGHDAELEFANSKIHVRSGWRQIDGAVFISRV